MAERDKKEAFISSKAFRFCRFYFTYLKIHSYYLCVYMNVVIFCHRHLLFHSSYFFFCFIDRFSNDLRIFIYCKYLKYTHTFEVRVKEKDRHKVTKISYFVLLLLFGYRLCDVVSDRCLQIYFICVTFLFEIRQKISC